MLIFTNISPPKTEGKKGGRKGKETLVLMAWSHPLHISCLSCEDSLAAAAATEVEILGVLDTE